MLLALILCQLAASVIANPFHKYPSVFLLDVGNEELEKTNTEQIRLSVPGGSVALRYPAIGDGELIGHLRVSSIDFGTALKANIVDGGPGYKYAVLVLMGNRGVPYDAVVTVQTVNEQSLNIPNVAYDPNSAGIATPVEEDENNSAEDVSDGPPLSNYQSESIVQNSQNAELTQSSDNVYSYVKNEVADESDQLEEDSDFDDSNAPNEEQDIEEDDDDDSENGTDDTGNENDQTDIHKEYTDDVDQVDDSNVEVKGIDTYDDDNDDDISPELEQYVPNDYAEDKPPNIEEEKYGQPDEVNVRPDYQQVPLDYEEAYDMDPIFNDGEVHNNGDKYRDSNNNNYIDSDDNYAVAY